MGLTSILVFLTLATPSVAPAALVMPGGKPIPLLKNVFPCAKSLADLNLAFYHVRPYSPWHPQDILAFMDGETFAGWYFMSSEGLFHHRFPLPRTPISEEDWRRGGYGEKIYEIQLPRHFSFYIQFKRTRSLEMLGELKKFEELEGLGNLFSPLPSAGYLLHPLAKPHDRCIEPACETIRLAGFLSATCAFMEKSLASLALAFETGIVAYELITLEAKGPSKDIERFCKD